MKIVKKNIEIINGGGDYKPVVLFGTGRLAEEFYKKTKDIISIEFCLDNDNSKYNIKFHGKKIYSPYNSDINISKYKIIIVSMYYSEIATQLKEIGLKEFENFIPWNLFNKKMAVIYGNCHTDIIKKYLEISDKFCELYGFYEIPKIYTLRLEKRIIDDIILKNCDLFIYQYVSEDYGGYQISTDYIMKSLSLKCIHINIPNLFGVGKMFFPQAVENPYNKFLNTGDVGYFAYGDKNIMELVNNYNVEEIIYKIKGDIYSRNYVVSNFNLYLKNFIENEKHYDIKLSRYILKNYRKRLLFYAPGYPTNFLLKKTAKEILKFLNIEDKTFEKAELVKSINLDNKQIPIYPCVKKYLELHFEVNRMRCTVPVEQFRFKSLTFEDYVKEYIKWCYY